MLVDFRHWIRGHASVVMSFAIGIAFGASIVALAYFASRGGAASNAFLYVTRATGHADLGEDLLWLLVGIAIGGGISSYAWWRDGRARPVGLDMENVLNRIATNPNLRIVGGRGGAGRGSEE